MSILREKSVSVFGFAEFGKAASDSVDFSAARDNKTVSSVVFVKTAFGAEIRIFKPVNGKKKAVKVREFANQALNLLSES